MMNIFARILDKLSGSFSLLSTLTPEQREAADTVIDRIADGYRFTTLTGYAGTGKTFVLGAIVDVLCHLGYRVCVSAPTHKAVEVARRAVAAPDVEKKTTHALLGLRLVPDGTGAYALRAEVPVRFEPRTVCVVDEVSMIGRTTQDYIEGTGDVQWIFVGDPAQLPPVGEATSGLFNYNGYTLTEVVRQTQGNPITAFATAIREGRDYLRSAEIKGDEGVALTKSQEDLVAEATEHFTDPAYNENPDVARILAYRNKTVRRYNQLVREQLFGADVPRFLPGEWLVGRETWYDRWSEDDATRTEGAYGENAAGLAGPAIRASETVCVEHAEVGSVYDEVSRRGWKTWDLMVRPKGTPYTRRLTVLHEEEWRGFAKAFYAVRESALKDGSLWKDFYHLRERFARVRPAFASTIHRAQGSSYDYAFLDHADAMCCRGPERKALLYVGASRAKARQTVLL